MAYENEWWERGRARQGASRGRLFRDRDPVDWIEKIAGWGMTIAKNNEDKKQKQRNHVIRYLESTVKDIDRNYDNAAIDKIEASISSFWDKTSLKDDLETQQIKSIFDEKIKAQKRDNTDYDSKFKEWKTHADKVEVWMDTVNEYSNLSGDDEDALLEARNAFYANDSEYQAYLLSNNMKAGHDGYVKFKENQMTNYMNEYGKYFTEFGAKYADRIPQQVYKSMETTQYYMDNVIKDWHKDGKFDDEEFFAYNDMIQHGNVQRVTDLRKTKNIAYESRISNTHELLSRDVLAYKKATKQLQLGWVELGEGELSKYFPKGDYLSTFSATAQVHRIEFDWKDYKGNDPIMLKKKNIARKLYNDYIREEAILRDDIEHRNKVLEKEGIYDTLYDYNFVPWDAKKNSIINQIKNKRKKKNT